MHKKKRKVHVWLAKLQDEILKEEALVKKRRITSVLAAFIALVVVLTSCTPSYEGLDADVTGELDIMLWSGDNSYTEDVGHLDIPAEELVSQNVAAAYAVAKAFNEVYPDVKINIYAKQGGPDEDEVPWAQELENFRAERGKYPDIYASTDLIGDIQKGMVADLSIFEDDPLYQSFNDSIMGMMNYYGFQAGIPQFVQPWGVYVNRGLAEDHNLDVPEPDWDIDDYNAFIRQADNDTFYGAMDVPMNFIRTGTESVSYMMANREMGSDEPFVNLGSEQVFALMDDVNTWADYAVNPQNDLGNVPAEFMEANDWWSYNFFKNGTLLTLEGDPWMMGDAANPNPEHWGAVQSSDWDIYPRPATDYVGNTVGVVLDPMVVINYALDDGDPALSEEEEAKTKLAYTFAAFWAGDTASWQARADQEFNDSGNMKSALNDSLPLVTGDAFGEQLDIWGSIPGHQRFMDESLMPGWQKVIELWEAGEFWDVSDKSHPWYYTVDGETRPILYEWDNIWNPEIAGAARTDANFADSVKSRLPGWSEEINQRFADAENGLRNALIEYYGYTEADFD